MRQLAGGEFVAGNHAELLIDGPATYRSMLEDIRGARNHIHLETYQFGDGDIGERFADALIEKSRSGVKVSVIIDAFGSCDTAESFFKRLKKNKIDVFEFNGFDLSDGETPNDVEHRNHRKLLIVDGCIAFTGGINIADEYSDRSSVTTSGNDGDGWRDTHVRITGPVVADLQRSFLDHWRADTPIAPAEFFPPLEVTGDHSICVVAACGDDDACIIRNAYLAAAQAAHEQIWLTQAYFVPDDSILDELSRAARRGVDVRILLPGDSDFETVRYAARAKFTALLEAGMRIYETRDTVLHAKTAVVDGVWSTVGSANLDHRSLHQNDEINVMIISQEFGKQLAEQFRRDIECADELDLDAWRERSVFERVKESTAHLFRRWL
jgi:cardiolipin synthase